MKPVVVRYAGTVLAFVFFGILAAGSSGDDTKKDLSKTDSKNLEEVLIKKVATIGQFTVADYLSTFSSKAKSLKNRTREESELWDQLQTEKANFPGQKVVEWECKYWGEQGALGPKPSCNSRYYVVDSSDEHGSAGQVWFKLQPKDDSSKNLKAFQQDTLIVSGTVKEIEYAEVRINGTKPYIRSNYITISDATIRIKPKK